MYSNINKQKWKKNKNKNKNKKQTKTTPYVNNKASGSSSLNQILEPKNIDKFTHADL